MLGERLRALRERHGLSQQQVADKLGMSASAVGMYEQNRRQPDNETLKKFSNLFDTSIDYLLGNDIKTNNDNKELLETISTDLSDPLNKALYSKASELKNAKDKQIVLNIIESFIKGVNDEK